MSVVEDTVKTAHNATYCHCDICQGIRAVMLRPSRDNRVEQDNEHPCNFDPGSRHYDAGGIETIEIIRAKLTPEQFQGFCLGNVLKYTARANFKGNFDRDIEKAGYYRRFLIEARGEKA